MRNYPYEHLMLDMETLGDRSNSVILSIAIVAFDLMTGATGPTFYEKIDIQSCLDAGLNVTGDTIRFWLNQPNELNLEVLNEGKDFLWVMKEVHSFIANHFGDGCNEGRTIWSRGRRFDIGLLADALHTAGYQLPWHYSVERDVRTLEALRPAIKAAIPFTGQRHHALDDCYHQIKYCSAIWNELNSI